MKNNKSKLAEEWFQKAFSDFQYAKVGQSETKQHHITCFLCQQVCEKILKGLLTLKGKKPPRIHNLRRLLALVMKGYPSLEALQKEMIGMSPFYVAARYPDDININFNENHAIFALDTAQKLILLCKEILIAHQE